MMPTSSNSTPGGSLSIAVRLILVVFVLTAMATATYPAGAQTPPEEQPAPTLTSLTVDLWPEFDRPSMLVMYQFSLSADFKAPGEVRIRIPAEVGSPNAVAVCEPAGNCFNTPFTTETSGEWTTLVISATMPDVRVEYYDPRLQKDGSSRHFEFQWAGDFAVSSMRVHVQQPAGAQQMRISPGSVTQSVEADGLTYYTLDVGSLSAGQTVSVEVDYTKETDDLSTTNLPVEPIEPLTTPAGGLNVSSSAPMILGGVGLALILGGGLWYWYSGRQHTASKEPRRRTRRKASGQAPETESSPIYCHQCGNRAAPADRFCRTCGAPLRK